MVFEMLFSSSCMLGLHQTTSQDYTIIQQLVVSSATHWYFSCIICGDDGHSFAPEAFFPLHLRQRPGPMYHMPLSSRGELTYIVHHDKAIIGPFPPWPTTTEQGSVLMIRDFLGTFPGQGHVCISQ